MNDIIQWPCAKYWNKAWNPVIGCKLNLAPEYDETTQEDKQ